MVYFIAVDRMINAIFKGLIEEGKSARSGYSHRQLDPTDARDKSQ
jgi:hypothetical protein